MVVLLGKHPTPEVFIPDIREQHDVMFSPTGIVTRSVEETKAQLDEATYTEPYIQGLSLRTTDG